MLGLHRVDQRARCRREQRHLAVGACGRAERADDGVLSLEGFAQRCLVADVSDDEPGAFEIACFRGRPHQRGDLMSARQRLADDQTSGAAGRSEHQYLRRGRLGVSVDHCCSP